MVYSAFQGKIEDGVAMKKVSVSLNDEKAKLLLSLAKEKGETQTTIMRLALEQYAMQERKKEK